MSFQTPKQRFPGQLNQGTTDDEHHMCCPFNSKGLFHLGKIYGVISLCISLTLSLGFFLLQILSNPPHPR
eukprot:TRINITY_DN9955_c0_g1_i1.p2 TRINITY_DN9955_c0_g1~~TRINITY_DN9955_c0_g1_i1.p2  ORF type:complete len:70 (+),score=4.07 TRINITY_DN9955_c0_g1_i1:127-336(+)